MSQKINVKLLSESSLDSIAFGMENQDFDYVLCLNDGNVYPSEDLDEYFDYPDLLEFVDLPQWTSADGYRLMSAFAQSCNDAKLRKRLNDVLNSSSHGVFKRFRAVLDTVDGATEAWYKFKDKRMHAHIRSWYRKLMADRPSPSKDIDLIELIEDINPGELFVSYDIEHLENLDADCLDLEKAALGENAIACKVVSAFTNQEAFCAYQDGKLCGMVAFEVLGKSACVLIYYIEEKSRGVGLFETLFDLMNRDLERRGVYKVLFPLQDGTKLENFFENRGVLSSHLYGIKEYSVEDWNNCVDSQETAYLV